MTRLHATVNMLSDVGCVVVQMFVSSEAQSYDSVPAFPPLVVNPYTIDDMVDDEVLQEEGGLVDYAEVAKHNAVDDPSLWIVVGDKVYDVSNFAASHPGGQKIIRKYAGKVATEGISPFPSMPM